MSSSSGVEKKITLKSSDGEIFEVEDWVAKESHTINHMMEVNCADSVFLLAEVTGPILSKVIEYCKKHGEARPEKKDDLSSGEELENWDRDFVKVNHNTIWDLRLAANYLNIKSLKDLTRPVFRRNTSGGYPQALVKLFALREEVELQALREWTWHWIEMAKKLLIIFGIVTYIGMCIIRMVWVLYQI